MFQGYRLQVTGFRKIAIFLLLLILTTYYLLLTTPSPAFAACNKAAPTPDCAAGVIQIQQLVTRLINISVTIAFMALTVWLIWGALKFFITSGGDPKSLAHAWSSLTWAFMGLFFMVLAWLVMKLIFNVTGFDVTQYCLGFRPYCL
jgi:hypothetical protein